MSALNPTPTPEHRAYKWWVVLMLWGVCFFNYADRQAIFAVFPALEKEFDFSKAQLGLIGSAFMWIYAGAAPFAGYIGDRFRRKTLILGGFFFWSLITLATGWAKRFSHLITIRAAEGFGEAFYFPASMSLISDYHGSRTRSRAMSLHQSSVYIGTIGGSALAGFLAEHYGWRAGFYLLGFAGMGLGVVLIAFLKEPARGQSEAPVGQLTASPPPSAREVAAEIFRKPTAILLLLAFVGANFVAMTFLAWMPSFLFEKFQLRLSLSGLAATIFIQLASAMGAPTGGILADRLARWHPGGRMIVQAIGLTAGSTFVFLTGTTLNAATLVVAMVAFGFCKGLYDANIFASLYDVIPPRTRASAAGVMNAVGWIGGACAPAMIGFLLSSGGRANEVANMSRAIAFGGAIYLVAAFLLLIAILGFARRDVLSGSRGASAA